MKTSRLVAPLSATLITFGSLVGGANATLLAHYAFNDAGNLGLDSSLTSTHATNNGATYTASGFSGGAAIFNGSSDYLRSPINVNPGAMSQMTWGAWAKTDSTTPVRAVLSGDNGGFDRNLNIDSRGGGTAWSAFTGSGVTNSGIAPVIGEWVFIAAAYDESANTMRLHVNDQTFTVNTNFGNSNSFFDIGRNPRFGEYFNGTIDEVFIFDEFLSESAVDDIRLNGVPEPSSALLLGFGALALTFRRSRQ